MTNGVDFMLHILRNVTLRLSWLDPATLPSLVKASYNVNVACAAKRVSQTQYRLVYVCLTTPDQLQF